MNIKVVRRLTATFRARGPSVGDVTIQEFTEFEEFEMLNGAPQVVERIKAYSINPREPVNRDDSGFTLARTGELLIVL